MNIFGYAGALEADERAARRGRGGRAARDRGGMADGLGAWRDRIDATIMHGHWVVPGGRHRCGGGAGRGPWSSACTDRMSSSPSGTASSDAPRDGRSRRAGFVTACSDDLRRRALALGASARADRRQCRTASTPTRSSPMPEARAPAARSAGASTTTTPVVFAVGPLRAQEGLRVPDRRHRRTGARASSPSAGAGRRRRPAREFDARIARSRARRPRRSCQASCHQDDVAASLGSRRCRGRAVGARPLRQRGRPAQRRDGGAGVGHGAGSHAGRRYRIGRAGWPNWPARARADPSALVAAIGRLLDNRTEAVAIGAAARHWVEQSGNWSHALDGFEQAYEIAGRRTAVLRSARPT